MTETLKPSYNCRLIALTFATEDDIFTSNLSENVTEAV
jgi:hypothetical protein